MSVKVAIQECSLRMIGVKLAPIREWQSSVTCATQAGMRTALTPNSKPLTRYHRKCRGCELCLDLLEGSVPIVPYQVPLDEVK